MDSHRSGFVAIIGKPNAGKSTFLNTAVGRKLSIVTPKAQTTRHRILGIVNGDDFQIVFSDTPGVIRPKYKLHQRMMRFVEYALADADLVVMMVDLTETFPEEDILKRFAEIKLPRLILLNKKDVATSELRNERKSFFSALFPGVEMLEVSSTVPRDVKAAIETIVKLLPEGPPYFDKDTLSDRPERFFVAEIIREKIFMLLAEEVPYSCEVGILQYEERDDKDLIRAEIHVERQTQKGIIIGKGGAMIKAIGTEARKDIEAFLGKPVFLELYVRVADSWKDNDRFLRDFGYQP